MLPYQNSAINPEPKSKEKGRQGSGRETEDIGGGSGLVLEHCIPETKSRWTVIHGDSVKKEKKRKKKQLVMLFQEFDQKAKKQKKYSSPHWVIS